MTSPPITNIVDLPLGEACQRLLQPHVSLLSAKGEINLIGLIIRNLKVASYTEQKRILEYVASWVESEHKHQEKRNDSSEMEMRFAEPDTKRA